MTGLKVQRLATKEVPRLISILKAIAPAMCVEEEPRYFFASVRVDAT
jgi:hypothetical protein